MKVTTTTRLWLLAVLALCLMLGHAKADYGIGIVGYVNTTFQPGDHWFGNPLLNGANDPARQAIWGAPVGTTVSLWDPISHQFSTISTWNGSAWSVDFTLEPGMGALLHTPSQFVNTFVGEVLNFDGSPLGSDPVMEFNFRIPPPFTGPSGQYLLSSKCPLALSGNVFDPLHNQFSVFEGIIGRAPRDGEQVTTFDSLTQTSTTHTFLGGAWSNGDPSLGVSQAAMFTIIQVPEPSLAALLGVGIPILLAACRRRR